MRSCKIFYYCALIRIFVFTLIFILGMPSVVDMAFASDQQLKGTYIRSNEQREDVPSNFIEFFNGSYIATMRYGTPASDRPGIEKGQYNISGDSIEFVSSGGIIGVYKLSRTNNTITINNGRHDVTFVLATKERAAALEAHRVELQRKLEEEYKARQASIAEEARREEAALKAAGFIAKAPSPLSWADAQAFCLQKGGRLPLIGGMTQWNGSNPHFKSKKIPIDGFGATGAAWPFEMHRGSYWAGTASGPNASWTVDGLNNFVNVSATDHVDRNHNSHYLSVVCVSLEYANEVKKKAEEEARKKEEARRKEEEALRAIGFIALASELMNWHDANAFCASKGGKLPRINYSDSWDGDHPWDEKGEATIDGFGAMARGAPWPAGLPSGSYWTGTEQSDIPGVSWDVGDFFGEFVVSRGILQDSNLLRVVCVPSVTEEVRKAEEARKAEPARRAEAARKAEEASKVAEEALRANGGRRLGELGFIALSESRMNWADAKAYCQQQSGRLPRVNNSDSLGSDIYGNHIDGFGSHGRPWDEIGLPHSGYSYWTGTVVSDRPGHAWDVGGDQGTFHAGANDPQDTLKRVVCVPLAAGDEVVTAPAVSETATPVLAAASSEPQAAASISEAAPMQSVAASPAPFYPPLAATDGKPKAAAHLVRLENDAVELALQMLAPGKSIEAVRIDNLGGVSSLWRSDGKDKAAPLSVSQGGTSLSSGAQVMSLSLGDTEALFSLSLKDNGSFAGKSTEFRVTVFFVGGERVMCILKVR